jgi:hypothetical protein
MMRGAAFSALTLAAVLFGCQTGPRPASVAPVSAEGATPGAVHVIGHSAGEASEAGAGGAGVTENGAGGAPGNDAGNDAGGATDGRLFGTNEIVSAAVEGCEKPSAPAPILVVPASLSNAVYDRLGSIGARRFAYSRDAQSLLTFDAAGNLSTSLNDAAGAASNGTALSLVFQNATRTVLQRYDENLAAQGGTVELASGEARSVTVATTPSATLVAWIDGDQIVAGVSAGDSLTKLSIPLGENPTHCRLQAASAGTDFVLVWTCTGTPNELRWALVSDAAELLKTTLVVEPAEPLELVAITATGAGHSLMLHSLLQKTAFIVTVDSKGQVNGSIQALSGLPEAFDLAATSSGLSMTALLEDGTTALGRLSQGAAPNAATWTCLDQTSPGGHAAVETVEQGNSVLVRHANGSEWLMALPY